MFLVEPKSSTTMASKMPIPAPPRTPTPPSDDNNDYQSDAVGLRKQNDDANSPNKLGFNHHDMLSPLSNHFPMNNSNRGTQSSAYLSSPVFPPNMADGYGAGSRRGSTVTEKDDTQPSGNENQSGPFGFQTVQYTVGRPLAGKSVRAMLVQKDGRVYLLTARGEIDCRTATGT